MRVITAQTSDAHIHHMSTSKSSHIDDRMRPAGAASSPDRYDNEHGTPPYLKWARDFHYLMDDSIGIQLFQQYLNSEGVGDFLTFWLACEGLKKTDPNDAKLINKYTNIIYKRYIKDSVINLSDTTIAAVSNTIRRKRGNYNGNGNGNGEKELNRYIFDDAQKEIEDLMTNKFYFNFLKSDVYLRHLQEMQNECLKSSGTVSSPSSSGSVSVPNDGSKPFIDRQLINRNQFIDFLPTLHEDTELQTNNVGGRYKSGHLKNNPFDGTSINCQIMINPLTNTLKIQNHPQRISQNLNPRYVYDPHPVTNPLHQSYYRSMAMPNPPHPYHVKYSSFLPTSAQDSELQSLSSGAVTDDTMSCPGDGESGVQIKKQLKQQNHFIKQNVKLNANAETFKQVIPRTAKLPQPNYENSMIAEKNPPEFAKLLMGKLDKVFKEREMEYKTSDTLNMMALQKAFEEKGLTKNSSPSSVHHHQQTRSLRDVMKEGNFKVYEENDQSILDQHIQRVFDETPNETPNKPGIVSPSTRPAPQPVPQPVQYYTVNRNHVIANDCSNDQTMTTTIGYRFSNEKVPYIIKLSGHNITLRRFKQQMPPKKGNLRYYFKRRCEEFGTEYVMEEITNDNEVLPLCDGKIFAVIELVNDGH